MEKTLYIPDELWKELSNYLKQHPQENLSNVIQIALKEKLRSRNGTGLLKLAGIVKNAPADASTNINSR
ncbi:hypothetical protein ACN4EE_21405 [Geminocystis sp. CENA526]|uniref:hypothetical protein n=1 Tax=Geminocystis sp. CENA526 TaxID=1355871 RepID=UPI003D6FEEDB